MLTLNSIAQEPYYTNIGINELTGVDIYSITERESGEMVFSTDNGIYEYDGYKFINVQPPKGKSKSLFGLIKDRNGVIFCYDLARNIYSYENQTLELYFTVPKTKDNAYISIVFDLNNDMIIKKSNYYRLNKNKEYIKILDLESTPPDLVYRDNEPILLQISKKKIYTLSNGVPKLKSHLVNLPTPTEAVFTINSGNELYLATSAFNRVYKINGNNFTTIKNKELDDSNRLDRFFQLNDSLFIVVKKKGESSIVNIKTGENINEAPIFKGYYISSAYLDLNGGLWLGTLKRGIIFIPNLNANTFDNVLIDESFTSISQNKHKDLFIGTLNGKVYRIDKNQNLNLFAHSINDRDVLGIKDVPQKNGLLINTNLFDYSGRCIFENNIALSTKHVIKINDSIYGFSTLRSFAIINIIGSSLKEKIFSSFQRKEKDGTSWFIKATEGCTFGYYSEINEILYLTTGTAFLRIDAKSVTELKYRNKFVRVNGIVEGEEGLLIATMSNGLLVLKNNELEPFLNENQFNYPIDKLKKQNQTVYFSSREKIFYFNEQDKILHSIDRRSGLKPDKIIDFLIQDNILWVISNLSIQSIDLNNQGPKPASLKCYLKEVYVNDSLSKSHKSFDSEHNNFSFKLLNSLMSNGKDIKYEYRLIGFDTERKETAFGVNIVAYNNLLPGNYTFKARAINVDGSVSEEISYSFTIYPPYWKTWWFISLIVLGIFVVIISVFVFRIRFVKKKLVLENRVKTSEIRTIKAQMNPHFIFNSLNSIQDLILSQDIRKSNHYLSVFADLMRNVMTVSGQDEISIELEIEILTTYISLEKLRFEDDLHVEINCDLSRREKEEIKIPSLLVQPYIENAFKHGLLHKKGAKSLVVNFYREKNGDLICEIIDNGIGFTNSKKIQERRSKTHKSFSVFANQKRIELINDLHPNNKKIILTVGNFNESELNPGTKLELRFPI